MTTKEKGQRANQILWELKELCYADDLEEFDALHDDLHWQIEGLYESLHQAEADGWSDDYDSEFQDALDLALDIRKYRDNLLKLSNKNFKWIYG